MSTITFQIDFELQREFKRYCFEKQVPMYEVLSLAIQKILKKDKKGNGGKLK